MINIERIVNPYESLEEIKQKLAEKLKDDYSSKYTDLIKERINNGNYFFETTPDIKLLFMVKNNVVVSERDYIEYTDYEMKKQEIARNLTNELFELYAISFGLTTEELIKLMCKKEAFIKLPIYEYYNNPQNIDIKRKYLEQCEELGIRPLLDKTIIKKLLTTKTKYEKNSNTKMITDTMWGRRISEEFNKKIDSTVSPEIIAEIIFGLPCNAEFQTKNLEKKKVLYFPIMRQCIIGDTDTSFLHEIRHMIESGRFCSGLSWIDENYKTLNEIRVEKHAIEDNESIGTIFSKEPIHTSVYLPYRMLFPFANEFIDEYRPIIDEIAITQNIPKLEEIFGTTDMRKYGDFLNQEFANIINSKHLESYIISEQSKNKSKEYIKKIDNNAKRNIN